MEKVTPFYGMKFAIIRYELNRNTYIYLIKAIGIGNGKSASETHCRAVVIVLSSIACLLLRGINCIERDKIFQRLINEKSALASHSE